MTSPKPTGGAEVPILRKTPDFQWPSKLRMFYLVTREGLFLCRNHDDFRSSVPVEHGPAGLSFHTPTFRYRGPRLSREKYQIVIGFFAEVARQHQAEAALLILWNQQKNAIELVAPPQIARVSESGGRRYAHSVEYTVDAYDARTHRLIGDVHSHVYGAAYASWMDKDDEVHRPGLHLVVGRLDQDPPELHVECVVDGRRFRLDPEEVIGGFTRPSPHFPEEWMDRLTVDVERYEPIGSGYRYGYGYGTDYGYGDAPSDRSSEGYDDSDGSASNDWESRS